MQNFNDSTITKSVQDFVSYTADPFSYTIHAEKDPTKVYWESDPTKLYLTKYLVFDSGKFKLNPSNNFPLMGMGERAGSLFYKNETGGIHSRWAFDQANPLDNGLPPGRNMYGYQPFYMFQSETNNQFVGVFDLSSYATDYILYYNETSETQITKINIGGII
jgi:hypothetical protein